MRIAVIGPTGATGGAIVSELVSRGHEVLPIGRRTAAKWDLQGEMSPEAVEVVRGADVVVHAAADIRLGAPREHLRRVNVDAVEQLLQVLAAAPTPPRLVHISSAFVEGEQHNNYEWSKREAEHVARAADVDVVIVRPSLVIGSRHTGQIARFSGMYVFLRMLRLGLVPAVPGCADVRVDIVPADVVAGTVAAAITDAAPGSVLTASTGDGAPTLQLLIDTAFDAIREVTGEDAEPPKLVRPDVYHRLFRPVVEERLSPAQLVLLETVEIFLPYFERDHVFEPTMAIDAGEVLDAWYASVVFWLHTADPGRSRGRAVWSTR